MGRSPKIPEEHTDVDTRPRILIVDDEAAVLQAIRRDVETRGLHATTCTDPTEALRLVESEHFDVIISDNRMPELSGVELLDKVRALSPDTVRIMLSGYADLESAIAAINRSEIHRFVLKPWQREQLLAHIEDAMQVGRLRARNRRLTEELQQKNDLLAQSNDALRAQVVRDPMTGLYNHGEFQIHLAAEVKLAARTGQPFSLALGDIDDFKQVNDTHGHPVGDAVIKAVADTLVDSLRDGVDTCYRYGGEEFALILRGTAATGATVALERLLTGIRKIRVPTAGDPIGITMSVGVAQYETGMTNADIAAAADGALYQAKGSGKDRIMVWLAKH